MNIVNIININNIIECYERCEQHCEVLKVIILLLYYYNRSDSFSSDSAIDCEVYGRRYQKTKVCSNIQTIINK